MSFRPTKLSAWVPWSDDDLEDYGDGLEFLRAQGWPNRCARLPRTPCFVHTRFSETCS